MKEFTVTDPMTEIDLVVGSMFTTTPKEDRGAYEEEREWLSDIQDLLREEGVEVDLLSHPGVEVWEGGIERFRDLYNLRRLAAYLEDGRDLAPVIADLESTADEEELDELLSAIWEGDRGSRYSNLINHQGEGGYYLPANFAEPIWVEFDTDGLDDDDDFDEEESVISFGSSIALQRELADLEPQLLQAGVPSTSAPIRCLKVLRAAADASVANNLPIIVW
jgi:hypothetical protein